MFLHVFELSNCLRGLKTIRLDLEIFVTSDSINPKVGEEKIVKLELGNK